MNDVILELQIYGILAMMEEEDKQEVATGSQIFSPCLDFTELLCVQQHTPPEAGMICILNLLQMDF